MSKTSGAALLCLLSTALTAQEQGPRKPTASEVRTRKESPLSAARRLVLETAKRYRDHEWTAQQRHVFHGKDSDGVRVDTPDAGYRRKGFEIGGVKNRGVPYKWGGFASIEAFDRGLAAGRYAGQVPSSGSARSSRHAVGVDCSGFVSRCWQLPTKESTRSLGRLAYTLGSYDELLPGDAINLFDRHVVLFKRFEDGDKQRIRIVESGGPGVRERVVERKSLEEAGFVPIRYKPLDPRWAQVPIRAATTKIGKALFSFRAKEQEKGPAPRTWPRRSVGDWASYRFMDRGPRVSSYRSLRLLSRLSGTLAEVQEHRSLGGGTAKTAAPLEHAGDRARTLLAFPGFAQAFLSPKLVKLRETDGSIVLDGRRVPATRIRAELSAQLLIRSVKHPIRFEIDMLRSPFVPVHGIAEAAYRITVTWMSKGKVTGTAKELKQFRLESFRWNASARR